ncbi:hypothetical protein FGO68_gene15018 [Halteria grandinella]|uniref:Uncharacterized protein n=1 Tax=Halteria grandinella TaxID=5974 RepID=A0A8J8STU3_HALGN|nr:hypothetical protein FGO68_gene15018 [Halteria grandinella]
MLCRIKNETISFVSFFCKTSTSGWKQGTKFKNAIFRQNHQKIIFSISRRPRDLILSMKHADINAYQVCQCD